MSSVVDRSEATCRFRPMHAGHVKEISSGEPFVIHWYSAHHVAGTAERVIVFEPPKRSGHDHMVFLPDNEALLVTPDDEVVVALSWP